MVCTDESLESRAVVFYGHILYPSWVMTAWKQRRDTLCSQYWNTSILHKLGVLEPRTHYLFMLVWSRMYHMWILSKLKIACKECCERIVLGRLADWSRPCWLSNYGISILPCICRLRKRTSWVVTSRDAGSKGSSIGSWRSTCGNNVSLWWRIIGSFVTGFAEGTSLWERTTRKHLLFDRNMRHLNIWKS